MMNAKDIIKALNDNLTYLKYTAIGVNSPPNSLLNAIKGLESLKADIIDACLENVKVNVKVKVCPN